IRAVVAPGQECSTVTPRSVEQAIGRNGIVVVEENKRFVGQGNQRVKRHILVHAAGGNAEGGFDIEAATEDRQAAEDPYLILAEKGYAPIERCRKRPVPLKSHPIADGKQAHVVVQPTREISGGLHAQACSYQLNGERNPVELARDPGQRRAVRFVEGTCTSGLGPL